MTGPLQPQLLEVKLIPEAIRSMQVTSTVLGHSWPDTVNRALQVYSAVCGAAFAGGGRYAFALDSEMVCEVVIRVRPGDEFEPA